MIITCEQCSTSFNLEESFLKETGSKVRCTVCKTVFTAYPAVSSDEPEGVESDAETEQLFSAPDRDLAEDSHELDAGPSEAMATEGDESEELTAEDTEIAGTADLDSDELEDLAQIFGAAENSDLVKPKGADTGEAIDFESDLETDELTAAEAVPEDESDASGLEVDLNLEESSAEVEPEQVDDTEELDLDLDFAFEETPVAEETEGEDQDPTELKDRGATGDATDEGQTDLEEEESLDLNLDFAFEETPVDEESEEEDLDLAALEDILAPEEKSEESEVDLGEEEETLDLDLDLEFEEAPVWNDEGEELDLSELEEIPLPEESTSEAEAEETDGDEALDLDFDIMGEQAPDSEEEADEIDLSGIEGLAGLEEDAESDKKSAFEEEGETLDLDFDQPDAEPDTEDEAALEEETLDLSDIEKIVGDEESPEAAEAETVEAVDDILVTDEAAGDIFGVDAGSGAAVGSVHMESVEEEEELEDATEEEEPVAEKSKKPGKKKRIGAPAVALLILILLGGGGYVAYIGLTSMGIQIPYLDSLKNIGSQIPFLSDWVKPTVQDAGNLKISTIDIAGKFINNTGSGKLFVITGNAKNGYEEPRALIKISGKLYSKGKQLVKTETIYCGNTLTDEQLVNLDLENIKKRLNNRSGDNKSDLNIAPGRVVPFMIVFSGLPENLEEYSIEVIESFPAAQK